MNYRITLIAVTLITSSHLMAQRVPATARHNASDSIVKTAFDSTDILIENRLVELALKSPAYSASDHQNRINELDLTKARNAWLNLLTISTNYNDQSFAKSTPGATIVYPKYFFGVTIPLGVIFSRGTQVKAAKESVAFSKDQQQVLARTLKSDILGKYKQYKLYNSLIKMQSELINDVIANSSQAEDNFKKGKISVETYITAQKTRNEEVAKNMNLKYQQDLIVLEIEAVIGIPLSEVLNPPPPAQLNTTPLPVKTN